MNICLVCQTLKALWRTGLLRMKLSTAWKILKAWRCCPGSFSFLAETAALRFGNAAALFDEEGSMTFSELRQAYEALCHDLITKHGIRSGRLVAIIEHNYRTFVIALLAAARTGADILLVNPDSPPKVKDRLLSSHAIDAILHGIDVEMGSYAQTLMRITLPVRPRTDRCAPCLPSSKRAGELQILTSGSTGSAKRIRRRPTLTRLLPTVLGLLGSLPITMHQPTVLAIPLFHGYGLSTLAMALAFAAPVHLSRKVEVAPLLRRDSMPKKPIVVSIPTLLKRWADAERSFSHVSAIITGSAPLDPKLSKRLIALFGPVLYNLYGSSEAGIVSVASPDILSKAPGSVGQPLPGNAVRIVDSEGRPVQPQVVGRILVRGPLVLKADSHGWFDTGDLGRLDDEQRLFICGRSDGMFISGGENVYPQEVEACLREHAFIEEAAIVVVADVEFGHRMHAFVVVKPGHVLTPAMIRAWLREKVERFKMPKIIDIVATLPRNQLGKIDRQALMKTIFPHLPSACAI